MRNAENLFIAFLGQEILGHSLGLIYQLSTNHSANKSTNKNKLNLILTIKNISTDRTIN